MRGIHVRTIQLAAVVSLIFAACGGSTAATTTAPETTTTTTTTAPTTTTTEAETTTTLPPDASADLDLPRSGVYAHVRFTIDDAVYSNRTPGTYFDDEPDIGDERYLFVDFTAVFEDGYPGISEDFDYDDFSLVLADGTRISNENVDFRGSLFVNDDGPQSWAFAFPGDDLDLEGATLQFDDDVHVPLEIALVGPPTTDPYPIVVEVDGDADVEYEGGCAAATGSVSLVGAEWDVDAGTDHDGDPVISSLPARAHAGEHILRITAQSIAAAGTCGGTVFSDDAFRLVVDGLPIGTENDFVTLLENGEGIEVVLAFRVPDDTVEASLEVGIPDGLTASFPIDIPTFG